MREAVAHFAIPVGRASSRAGGVVSALRADHFEPQARHYKLGSSVASPHRKCIRT